MLIVVRHISFIGKQSEQIIYAKQNKKPQTV